MTTENKDLSALAQLAYEWLAGRRGRGEITAASARAYKEHLAALLRLFGDRPVDELTRGVLLEWQLSFGHLAPATRRLRVVAVSMFCRWLVAEAHLRSDPSVGLVKPKEPRGVPRALPPADIPDIFAACPSPQRRYRTAVWLRPAVAVMVGCGLRCCEVCRLDLADYDAHTRTLFVHGKGGRNRVVPVPLGAAAELATYLGTRGTEPGPLFRAVGSRPAPDGRLSSRWVAKRTGQLMEEAGVHQQAGDGKTAHAFRHTFATDVYRASGNDAVLVQFLLGHASLEHTQRYLAPAGDDEVRQAVEGRSYLPAPVEQEREPEPEPVHARLHCPECCDQPPEEPVHGPECAGWQRMPVGSVTIAKTPAGWQYEGRCVTCCGRISGCVDVSSAKRFLLAGAVRAIA